MSAPVYYNEIDPYAAEWLRNLIDAGHIAPGVVDERSIEDVKPSDLKGFAQVHLFAGIGGWSLALRIAGWPDDRPVWTASCPCQDFSLCGKQAGFEGSRDFWPHTFRLWRGKRRPADGLLGEQVVSNLEWYDRAANDMESIGDTCGAVAVPACAVGANHERLRLWFFANATAQHGNPWDRVVAGGAGRTPAQPGGLSGLHVAGRWWRSHEWPERQPTLVRSHDGLSQVLGGFGNAIVPEVAAIFIQACMEASA